MATPLETQLQQTIDSLRDELAMAGRLADARKAMLTTAEKLLKERDEKIRTLQLEAHRVAGLLRQMSGQPGTDRFMRPRSIGEDGSLGGFKVE